LIARVGKPVNNSVEGTDCVVFWFLEGVVIVAVGIVRLVNEVPCVLPSVTLALNVVSKSCTFGHWVVTLVVGQLWVVFFEG